MVSVLLFLASVTSAAADDRTPTPLPDAFYRPFAKAGSLRVPGATLDRAADDSAPKPPLLGALGDSSGAWTEVPPPRRYLPHLLCDSVADRLLLFGARNGVLGGDAWELPLEGTAPWRRLAPFAGDIPPSLDGASSTEDPAGRRLVIFGGVFDHSVFFNFAYVLSLDPAPTWRLIPFFPGAERPDGRRAAALAVDSEANQLVVFGGYGRNGADEFPLYGDLWTLDLAGHAGWTRIETAGTAPAPRDGATLVHVPGTRKFLLYGGSVRIGERTLGASDELWELRLDSTPTWTRLDAPGVRPGASSGHAAFWDATKGAMIVHTLYAEPAGLFAFDPATDTWSQVDAGGTSPRGLPGRTFAHDRVRDRWLFYDRDAVARDPAHVDVLTVSPAATWSRLRDGVLPQGRFGQATVIDPSRDRMIVFGGVGSDAAFDPNGLHYLADPWSLDLADLAHWAPLEPTGSPPTPRHEPVGVLDEAGDRALFFGGWRYPDEYLADVWELTLGAAPHWSDVTPAGEGPPGRRAHAAVLDPLRHRMLMFGGSGPDSVFDDLWALEFAEPVRWVRLEPAGPRPTGRYFHSMTYDAGRDRVLMFGGGRDAQSLPEVWALSLAELRWALLPIDGYALALERHGAIHDAARNRLLVFGGWWVDYDLFIGTNAVFTLELDRPPLWRTLRPTGITPPSSVASSVVLDPRRDRMVVFGGGGFAEYQNAVWSLDFTAGPASSAWLLGAIPARGRVELAWGSSAGPGAAYDLERREAGGDWTVVARRFVDGASRLGYVDEELRPGWRYSYRLREAGPVFDAQLVASATMGEISVTIPGGAALDLLGARPNPSPAGQVAIWYSLVDPAGATLELLDVRGRRVWHRDLSGTAAGPQVARPDVRLAAGLYFSRLRQGADAVSRKVLVVP